MTYTEIQEMLSKKPLSGFQDEEFTSLIDELTKAYQTALGIHGITLSQSEFKQSQVIEKLEVILSIFSLLIAVNELPKEDGKRKIIQTLLNGTSGRIVQSLAKLSQFDPASENEWQVQRGRRSPHQVYLMINSLVYFYIRQCRKSENFQEIFSDINLDRRFNNRLDVSKIQSSKRNNAGGSRTEKIMINVFLNEEQFNPAGVSNTRALKENSEKVYIDESTGLELDLPLMSQVDIEYDGPFHFLNEKCEHHNLEHMRKEQQLCENNWIRLSINPKTQTLHQEVYGSNHIVNVSQTIARVFTTASVKEFIELHNHLSLLRDSVRKKIIDENITLRNKPQRKIAEKKKKNNFISDNDFLIQGENSAPVYLPSQANKSPALSASLQELLDLEETLSVCLSKNYFNEMINSKQFFQAEKNYDSEYFKLEQERRRTRTKEGHSKLSNRFTAAENKHEKMIGSFLHLDELKDLSYKMEIALENIKQPNVSQSSNNASCSHSKGKARQRGIKIMG